MPPRKKTSAAGKAKTAAQTKTKKAAAASKKADAPTGKRPRSSSDAEEEEGTAANNDAAQDESSTEPAQKRARKASEAQETTQESELSQDVGPIPSGKFDLYRMELPFLKKVYLPPARTTDAPQFEALYDTIVPLQTKSDFSGRCVIPSEASKYLLDGRLESVDMQDPMEEMPWEIALTDLEVVDAVVFTEQERYKFLTAPKKNCGKGIQGRTELATDHCGVDEAEGVFRMQRAWVGERDGKDVEMWEGFLSFNVSHSGMYRRKGHGGGQKSGFPFWAVRARKDDNGDEIGLEAP
ncbi:hypothetical protein R3P38DRAFT_2699993 [Favolaschia claudopus]|uniref:Uncharacterized protein n=1 Tax=Favolaschia claudopus TaxID=2862362 RepID=A0AAW0C048_9AGAR